MSLPRNYISVAFMYHDLQNLTVISATEEETKKLLVGNSETCGLLYDEVKTVGFEHLNRLSGVSLEKQLYKIAGVDLSKKWDNFFVERDFDKERALFNRVAPTSEYVFLHEDAPRNYKIERRLIDKKYAVFEPDEKLTENIFDYCAIIEKATEIHVIDSSFMFLIDCLKYEKPEQKLFIHRYARENETWKLPVLKKNWQILTLSGNRNHKSVSVSALLDKLEVLFLTHPVLKRLTRKLYRTFGWRTRLQKRGSNSI